MNNKFGCICFGLDKDRSRYWNALQYSKNAEAKNEGLILILLK